MEKKVKYNDLSIPVKIGIASAWVVGILYSLAVLIGFIGGVLS